MSTILNRTTGLTLGRTLSPQYNGSTISYSRLKSTAASIFRRRCLRHQAIYANNFNDITGHFPRSSVGVK